jgi:hypothetical protein
MSKHTPLIQTTEITQATPRALRGAAAVVAQYIQDLTHPSQSEPSAAIA